MTGPEHYCSGDASTRSFCPAYREIAAGRRLKIVSIVGTRPQFIKCSELSRELRRNHHEIIVHTGQHYDPEMSEVFFRELGIPDPDYNLGIGSGSHGKQTGDMIKLIESVLIQEKPDLVVVYGDTNSTLSGALAAAKLDIPIAHVEAGMRSFDRAMPEEINRVLTDHLSDLLFCPDDISVKNLNVEGIHKGIYITGDVMADSVEKYKNACEDTACGLYSVLTIHRPANTDFPLNMINIFSGIERSGKHFMFPMHPRTHRFLLEHGIAIPLNVTVLKPLGYMAMLSLISGAEKVVTDSGGIQKEAYILGVPCVTLRNTTEWLETLHDGWNHLAGTNPDKIVNALVSKPYGKQQMLFPTGASRKIADIITGTDFTCFHHQ